MLGIPSRVLDFSSSVVTGELQDTLLLRLPTTRNHMLTDQGTLRAMKCSCLLKLNDYKTLGVQLQSIFLCCVYVYYVDPSC